MLGQFPKEETCITNKYIKRCSKSQLTKEYRLKQCNTPFLPIILANIKNMDNTQGC